MCVWQFLAKLFQCRCVCMYVCVSQFQAELLQDDTSEGAGDGAGQQGGHRQRIPAQEGQVSGRHSSQWPCGKVSASGTADTKTGSRFLRSSQTGVTDTNDDSNIYDNNNNTESCNLRFFTTSSQYSKLSPTCRQGTGVCSSGATQPVQIMCKALHALW